jgi:hypothetical protein
MYTYIYIHIYVGHSIKIKTVALALVIENFASNSDRYKRHTHFAQKQVVANYVGAN